MAWRRWWLALALVVGYASALAAPAGRQDWLTLRDHGVERQQLDYSCGAAALATLLQVALAEPVSEKSLLALHHARVGHPLDTAPAMAAQPTDSASWYLSVADLRALAQGLGFDTLALAVTPQRLAQLRVPGIVYLIDRDQPHFVVLRGAAPDASWFALADPAWGNRSLRRADFLRQWLQVSDDDRAAARGVLVLLRPRSETEAARLAAYFQPPHDNSAQYLAIGQALR
jgi:uncharacterized protein